MPNNFVHIGLIRLILPNAKVIDARRNPMACCFSCFQQLFGEGQEFTYGLEEVGRYYRAYVRLMDHWDAVLPGHVLRVMHEDVVDDLETQVRRILDFCELPFEKLQSTSTRTEQTSDAESEQYGNRSTGGVTAGGARSAPESPWERWDRISWRATYLLTRSPDPRSTYKNLNIVF